MFCHLNQSYIDEFKNYVSNWKEKISTTNQLLSELPEDKLKHFDRSVQIIYPDDKTLIEIKSDAEFILQLLKEGKKITGMFSIFNNPLSPANIKQRKYFIQNVKVNGIICLTIEEFKTVLQDIKIKQDLEELESIWGIKPNSNSKSYFDKIKFYKHIKTETEKLLIILDEAQKVKTQIEVIVLVQNSKL